MKNESKVKDRFCSFNSSITRKHMKSALLSVAWNSDTWTFDALESHYRALVRYLDFQDQGAIVPLETSLFRAFRQIVNKIYVSNILMKIAENHKGKEQEPFSDFLLGVPLCRRQVFSCKSSGQVGPICDW